MAHGESQITPPRAKSALSRAKSAPSRVKSALSRAKSAGHLSKCYVIPQSLYVKALSYIKKSLLEPITIYGDGIYSLNGIQEITGTDSFMNMDQIIRGCNIRVSENVEDCTSRKFQESIVEDCGCSPTFLNFSKQEVYSNVIIKLLIKKILVWK